MIQKEPALMTNLFQACQNWFPYTVHTGGKFYLFVESSVSNDFSKGIENVQYLDTTAGRLEHYRLVQFWGENYKLRKTNHLTKVKAIDSFNFDWSSCSKFGVE